MEAIPITIPEDEKIMDDVESAIMPNLDQMKHFAYNTDKDQSITATLKLHWDKKSGEHRWSVSTKLSFTPTPIVRKAVLSQTDPKKPVQMDLFHYIKGDVE